MARDFGKLGVYVGEILATEIDSEGEDKVEETFVVEYTNGDRTRTEIAKTRTRTNLSTLKISTTP